MTDTPERIWAWRYNDSWGNELRWFEWDGHDPSHLDTEYVRADLLDAANARIAALEAMLTDDLTALYLAGLARGRAEALEEAARDCVIFDSSDRLINSDIRATCAAAIRAMKGGSNG